MRKAKVMLVVGARPNIMKVAPLIRQKTYSLDLTLVHTGQHFDDNMSADFFRDLGIPFPKTNLGVGSGSHADQTAKIMLEFEKLLAKGKPDYVLVVGDVNSTIACALVAAKHGIPVIHVEAGLRSFDRTMPEEINRILTDQLSSLLFVTEKSGMDNLKNEGISQDKVHFVGNVMIDTLCNMMPKIDGSDYCGKLSLRKGAYAVVTLHRPANVDTKARLSDMLDCLDHLQGHLQVVWPVHPRTRKALKKHGLEDRLSSFKAIGPIPYVPFLNLVKNSALVLTDSGGIQEETTYLGIPCVTARDNTERPSTLDGTNILAGTAKKDIIAAIDKSLSSKTQGKVPPLWDGKASERIVSAIEDDWSSS